MLVPLLAVLIAAQPDPCQDFYDYACNEWLAENPRPPELPTWSVYGTMQRRTSELVHGLLERAAKPGRKRPIERQVGDFFASCTDEERIDALGLAPIQPLLDRIAKIATRADLARMMGEIDRLDASVLFSFYSSPNPTNPGRFVADLHDAGRTVEARSFYLEASEQSKRDALAGHLERIFAILGHSKTLAASEARAVLRLETELTKVALAPVELQEAERLASLYPLREVERATAHFDWAAYRKARGAPRPRVVRVPGFARLPDLDALLATTPLEDWRALLTWSAIRALGPMLPRALRDERFRFSSTFMRGVTEQPPRWRTCVALADRILAFAVGKLYVDAAFPTSGKKRASEIAERLRATMERSIEGADWLAAPTRKQALKKLKAIRFKLAYPERWRDYAELKIHRGDALGNWSRGLQHEDRRLMSRIEQRVDRSEWFDPPTQLNGSNQEFNSILFSAAILQPPFFDPAGDPAAMYGAFGAVLGHEITHSFDNDGRYRDERDTTRNWWTDEDAESFEARTACYQRQYSGYSVAGHPLDGRLTLAENIADNGGLALGYRAFHALEPREDLDADRRLFRAWGLIRCTHYTDQEQIDWLGTDPHSPGRFRVNGVVSNMPEFARAFGCKADDPMVRAQPCRLW